MKRYIKRSTVALSLFVAFCSALFSFSPVGRGGDSFEIFLNGKLVMKQFLYDVKEVKSFQLPQASDNDNLDIYYSHCGTVGKNRSITIKDAQGKILKEWHFADATGSRSAMSFKMKEILSLQSAKNGNKLTLVYASKEIPGGRMLAYITKGSEKVTAP